MVGEFLLHLRAQTDCVEFRYSVSYCFMSSNSKREHSMSKLCCAVISVSLALPIAVLAADNPDMSFYKKAAEGGIAEVELGTMAQDKSPTQNVKDFGAMMVKDHSAANDKLKAIADSKNIKLPSSPSIAQLATKTKLEVLKGTAFDKSYIKDMVKDHQEDIKEFENEASTGQDAEAKAYASATLPTLKAHLKKIQAIAAAQGVDAS
jgi:putative membrane protein